MIRPDCKNPECGGSGDGWGSLGGYCVFCKHDADVGCKCILNDCGKKYWAKTMAEKMYLLICLIMSIFY